jgi:putative ABC transport system ATP-binding protein
VVVDGKNLTQQDENQLAEFRCRKIGFIYQNFHLIPSLTAWQNVEIPMIFNRVPRSVRREVALSLLAKVGLAERTNHRPAQLSGGQQQRVAIARALVNQPILLLADEPTGNLDSRTGQEVVALLKELASTQKVTVLMVTHDMSLIQQTDRYIRLQDGRIVEGR